MSLKPCLGHDNGERCKVLCDRSKREYLCPRHRKAARTTAVKAAMGKVGRRGGVKGSE